MTHPLMITTANVGWNGSTSMKTSRSSQVQDDGELHSHCLHLCLMVFYHGANAWFLHQYKGSNASPYGNSVKMITLWSSFLLT